MMNSSGAEARQMETAMPVRRRKIHPALKHAGYSAATLLPGEDRAAFDELHRDLAAEFQPVGTLEENIIASMARYVWRKNNLNTFRLAQFARNHEENLYDMYKAKVEEGFGQAQTAACEESERQARKDLREAYELVEVGDMATIDDLQKILGVEEYLDSLIDKCIKRLLHVRGVKSISLAPSSSAQECISAGSEK
jgi:hypothetical protein